MLAWLACVLSPQDLPPIDFVREVRPILVARCIECHGEEEQEGELRLDGRRHVFHDNRKLWVVIPGKPAESVLFERITLPSDHDDRMPSEGDPLTAEQIATIKRWIEAGASWPEEDPDPYSIPRPPADARSGIDAALQALRATGAHAAPVAAGHEGVEVDASWRRTRFGDAELALLAGLEPVLVRLELSHTAASPAAIAGLARFPHLRQLGLGQTAVDLASLQALAKLPQLEALNLFGTDIDDSAASALTGFPALRRVHLWETRISPAAVEKLRAARPELNVTAGAPSPPTPPAAVNTICPVSGKPVDPWLVHEHEGRRIGFCCAQCRAKFVQDPAAYSEKLK